MSKTSANHSYLTQLQLDAWWWSHDDVISPDAVALVDPDGRITTRSQLHSDIHRIASAMSAHGVQRQDRLALVMAPGPAMATSLLAAMAVAAVAPLVPTSPFAIVCEDLRRLAATHVLVDEHPPAPVIEAARQLGIPVLDLPSLARKEPRSLIPAEPRAEDLALLLQTSGTTSRPKAVPLSYFNLLFNARSVANVLRLGPDDLGLAAMPMFHIHGIVASLMAPLLAGGGVICARGNDPEHLLLLLDIHNPTWLSAVPTLLHAVLNASERQRKTRRASRLRFLRASSASCPPVLRERLQEHFDVPVLEAYGMTECYLICSNRLPGQGLAPLPGSVGAAAGPEVVILGSNHLPLPAGEVGEVAIRGPGVTAGYEAPDPSGWITTATGEAWFPTGDEGYLDQDGRLFLTGRLKEMINRGGEKVIPRRVDEVLLQHPDVDQALAFAVSHPTLGEDLVAAVVLKAGSNLEEQELRRHAFSGLSPHEVPSRILFLDSLPRGATGKLQRIGLAERLANALSTPHEPPVGELEELVASVMAEVLGQSQPSRDANFFLLGGDSLSGTRVVSQLAEQLGLALHPTLLFTAPTVRSLAAHLLNPAKPAPTHLVTLQPFGSRLPLYVVPGWGGLPGFTHLARALAPNRPVFGLKATIDGSLPQGASVTAFAKAFAEEILAAHSGGPIHLMGYSAGGWYAFALAAALLQRQAPLGVVAILDTNPIGRVPRQLGLSLFSRMLGAELAPKLLRCLRRRQGKQTRRRYVLDVLQDLRLRTSLYLRVPLSPNHRAIRRWFHGTKPPAPEPFVQLVRESGHPRQGLPLSVDLFAIPDSVAVLSQLWRFYASKGVRTHPLFNDHHDFYQPENAQELAQALEQVLQEGERHLPDREMRLEP
jgi:acyl-CoA synthetase (AMP-forming)/AMP-acid ligase II/acyl carrier protein